MVVFSLASGAERRPARLNDLRICRMRGIGPQDANAALRYVGVKKVPTARMR